MRSSLLNLSLASIFCFALPAAAHHVSGKVYCDTDSSGTITAGDQLLNGVQVTATSTGPVQVGTQFASTTPYAGQAGRYYMDLLSATNTYSIAIASGAPAGSTFITPATGSVSLTFTTGDPQSEAQTSDFLLGNCTPAPLCNPGSCDDGNPCTDDSCSVAGDCVHEANTKACNDNNACTQVDVCSGGACVGSNPLNCDDANPCTDDSCKFDIGCKHAFNDKPCDDNNACTKNEQCTNGACIGFAPVGNCDDNNPCTADSCDPQTGCVNSSAGCDDGNPCTDDICGPNGCLHEPNTKACNDNNACTTVDVCSGGVCVGSSAPNCDDANPCTDDTCKQDIGCKHSFNANPCNDGNACTKNEQCTNGACVGFPSAGQCDDGNACTTDSCDPQIGCVNSAANCDDGNPCTDDICGANGCLHEPNTKACNDNNACTTVDVCSGGVCVGGSTLNCDDKNPCTDDTCKQDIGCKHAFNANPCNDNDACTKNEQCTNGVCVGFPSAGQCDDGNACTTDSCDPRVGCVNTSVGCDDGNPCTDDICGANGCLHEPNTKSCNDNNACTTVDVCSGGVCVGSSAPNCDDANPCTDDTCKQDIGCKHAFNSNPCDDKNACTKNEQCTNGVCVGFPSAGSCDDNNPCTTDSCDAAGGCVNAPNSDPCNDNNACTTGDQCKDGACKAGTPKTCGAGDACHDPGVCDAQTGTCSNPTKPDGTSCNDNNTCSANDQCKGGVCAGSVQDCDDHNPCTDDSCGANGCVHTNNTASCNDGNLCTTGDICSAGACSGTPKTCDDNNLCNGSETCNPNTGACESSQAVNGPPFLFCSSARVNNRGTITGDIAVNDPNGFLHFARGIYMPDGTKITANEVTLASNSSVCSVFANTINKDPDTEIRCGTGLPTLPIVTPCCDIPAATCDATKPITVGAGATGAPLAPGVYGALTLGKNATLALKPGTFTFCSVDNNLGSQLTTSGVSTVNVTGDFHIADLAYFGPDAGQPLPDLNIKGPNVRLGEAGLIRAVLRAPNAEARFGRQATLEGTMCTNIIGTDKGITLSCQPQSNLKSAKKRQRHRRLRGAAPTVS